MQKHSYSEKRVFRMEHRQKYLGETVNRLTFWRGTYGGYGIGLGGSRLFCSLLCGLAFGVASSNAGMRIRRDK